MTDDSQGLATDGGAGAEEGATVQIRSYRSVFALERRLYRIDRIRLNPTGVPLRGIAYLLVVTALALLAGRIPLGGEVVRLVPWYLRDVAGPALVAFALTVVRIDGRPFHLVALALLRYWREGGR